MTSRPSPAPRPRGATRPATWAWAAAVLLVVAHAGVVVRKRNEGDLRVYHDTVARLPAGLDLYQTREGPQPDRPTGFIYPLPFALMFAPFTALPFPVLRGVWAVLMGLAALRALALCGRLVFPEGARTWVLAGAAPPSEAAVRAIALLVGVLVSLRFALSDIQHGQVNLLVLWLALEGVHLAEHGAPQDPRRDALAGALLAASTAVKLTPGLLVLGYAIGRRWRLVASAAATFTALVLVLPAIALGPTASLDASWRFVTQVTPWNASFHAFVGNNAALPGLLHRLLVGCADAGQPPVPMLLSVAPPTGRALAAVAAAAVLAASLVAAARLRGVTRAAFLFTAIPLVSPIAWKPHLVGLVLPCILAARLGVETSSRAARAALVAGAACLLASRELLGRELADAAVRWGVTTLGIALLAIALAATRPREAPPPGEVTSPGPAP